jgi:hypothetical protein
MQIKLDGSEQNAWGLADTHGNVILTEICADSDAARTLLKTMRIRQPHRPEMRVVPITIAIRKTRGAP